MKNFLQPPGKEVMPQLLVKPSHEPECFQWVHIRGDDILSVASGALEELVAFRETLDVCECIYLAPAGHVSLSTMPITDEERKLYRQMLPFAMEEGLIESTDALHFAFKALGPDNMGVALVQRELFEALLGELRGAGLRVDLVVPETTLLPWSEGQQTWALLGDELIARTGPCAGFVAGLETLGAVAGLPEAAGDPPCNSVRLLVERGADGERAAAELRNAGREVEVEVVDDFLAWLAPRLPAEPFNMLQGDFQPPLRWRKYWNDWKPVMAACLAALLLNYGVLLYHYVDVKETASALQAEKFALARKAIPSGKITSPERQLQAALSQRNSARPTNFGAMLVAVGPLLSGKAGYTVRTINYDGGAQSLRLEVRSGDFQDIEKFRTEMQQRGFQAKLLNSSAQGDGILARLELREGRQ